jgi:hypothetical protein
VFPGLSSNGVIGRQVGYNWQLDHAMGGGPPD